LAVQTKVRDAWNTLYRFDLSAQLPPDYEVSNWYVATHPESPFVGRLAAARAAPESRYALRNNELAVHRRGGDTERRVLTSVAQLRATLEEVFKLTLPDTPALDTCLARFI
jgi:N-hydroxyarylamine O-acetyltransferase